MRRRVAVAWNLTRGAQFGGGGLPVGFGRPPPPGFLTGAPRSTQLAVELGEFDQRAGDDTRMGTGLTARAPTSMADRNLFDGEAFRAGARENFGVHEGADPGLQSVLYRDD